MVKAEFSLFEMPVKHLFSDSFHLAQSKLGIGPERLNPIDVRLVSNKLITSMFNAIMLRIAHVDQTMVSTPTVRMDRTVETDFTPYYPLQSTLPGIRNDLGINPAVPFKKTKDDGFTTRTATPFATNALGSKIGFIHFNLCSKLRMFFAFWRYQKRKNRRKNDGGFGEISSRRFGNACNTCF